MYDYIIESFVRSLLRLAAIAFIAGALLVWLAPKAWAWIKPWLHALTA